MGGEIMSSIKEAKEIAEKFFSIFAFSNIYLSKDDTLEIEYLMCPKRIPIKFKPSQDEKIKGLWLTDDRDLTFFKDQISKRIFINYQHKCNSKKIAKIRKNLVDMSDEFEKKILSFYENELR